MAKAKELIAHVVLDGRSTSKFNALQTKLNLMSLALDGISTAVRGFGQESVETFKNYETYMLEAEGALSAQYRSVTERAQVMERLYTETSKWAATTIFDTTDVAKATAEAAHAGWDLMEMLEGIPTAMLLAQAGNIELADAMNYTIKALNATDTEFSRSGAFIDQWAMAANMGATNIAEIGDAILRMGPTARFADSTEELFTMLTILANMGTVGESAGTLLRNAMLRLVAPTAKASETMAELGVTEEEALELAADDALVDKAGKLLENVGFSAYDANGNLKPMLQTYTELYEAVQAMSDQDMNTVLSAIFPSRTITGAMALLTAMGKGYGELFGSIQNSEGYAAKVAGIQTSGLMGDMKAVESKWEEFQRRIGETAAPWVSDVTELFGTLIDWGNSFDDTQMAALTGGLAGIAAAAPMLGVAGGAMRLISLLGWPGSGFLVAVGGAGALIGYLNELNSISFAENFGTMGVDLDTLGTHVDGLTTKFSNESTALATWKTAVDKAQASYESLTLALSEDLTEAVLTGKTLTPDEIKTLESYGASIMDAVRNGLDNAEARDLTMADILFGDAQTKEEKAAFENAVDWTTSYYSGLYQEAEALGQELRDKMTKALTDNQLDEQERLAIRNTVDRLTAIQAEIANTINAEEYYAMESRARRVSFDSMDEYLALLQEKQATETALIDEQYDLSYGKYRNAWQAEYDKASPAERERLEKEWAAFVTEHDRERAEAHQSAAGKYGALEWTAVDALMNDSAYADVWNFITDNYGKAPSTWELPEGMSAIQTSEKIFYMMDLLKRVEGLFGDNVPGMLQYVLDTGESIALDVRFDFGDDEIEAKSEAAQTWLDDNPLVQNVILQYPVGSGVIEESGAGLPAYADGGRATSASIFGEAGAEWAIPEEHTDNTAALLNAARAASGFTWGELISKASGASGAGQSVQISYAPVIHANDARGVQSVLAQDKEQLLKMIRNLLSDMELHDKVEAFV